MVGTSTKSHKWLSNDLHDSFLKLVLKIDEIWMHESDVYEENESHLPEYNKYIPDVIEKAILETEEYKKFTSLIPKVEALQTYFSQFDLKPYNFVMGFFWYFIESFPEDGPKAETYEESRKQHIGVFDKVYGELETFLGEEVYVQAIAFPIYNFDMTSKKIHVTPLISIERILEDKQSPHHMHVFGEDEGPPRYELVIKKSLLKNNVDEFKKQFESFKGEAESTAKKFVNVIMLVKQEMSFLNFMNLQRETPWGTTNYSSDFILHHPRFPKTKPVKMKVSEEKVLVKYWNILNENPKSKVNIDHTAIRNYGKALLRTNSIEAIIDIFVGFESLMMRDNAELSYRLAIRTAILLSKDARTRNNVYKEMKKAYDYRSKAVHGSLSEMEIEGTQKQEELNKYLKLSMSHLREIILKFIGSEEKTIKQVIDLIDSGPFSTLIL